MEHPEIKGVSEIVGAVIYLLGRFIVLWFSCPTCSLMTKISQSSLTNTQTHTERGPEENSELFYSMTKPRALCAGMHAKIGDICLGIFKQWWTLYRSNISDGDIIDMHENSVKQFKKAKNDNAKMILKNDPDGFQWQKLRDIYLIKMSLSYCDHNFIILQHFGQTRKRDSIFLSCYGLHFLHSWRQWVNWELLYIK